MKYIIIYNGKPIYMTNGIIDWYIVMVALHNTLVKDGAILKKPDYDEYRSKNTIWGDTIESIRVAYDIKWWYWNALENDWKLY